MQLWLKYAIFLKLGLKYMQNFSLEEGSNLHKYPSLLRYVIFSKTGKYMQNIHIIFSLEMMHTP